MRQMLILEARYPTSLWCLSVHPPTGPPPAVPSFPTRRSSDLDEPALCGQVAKLTDDMLELAEEPRDVVILDENGEPLKAGDNSRRYFEAPWVHKYNGTYYFSYSTGDTHLKIGRAHV